MMFALSSRVSRSSLSRIAQFSNVRAPAVRSLGTIAEGVEFDTVAREWRCKWTTDSEKESLVNAQKAFELILPELKKVDGVIKVDRIVCGGCKDFKIITSMPAGTKYDAWAATNFKPEEEFLEMIKSFEGITKVDTQTYTIMPMYKAS